MQLTICIATWNRADLLERTLRSLTQLRVPPDVDWGVLVCDNNSSDHTRQIVDSFVGRLPVRYLFEAHQGKSYALNRMIHEAAGQWIFFIDDDVSVDPQWLESYANGIHRYPQAVCLGGPILPWLEKPVRGRQLCLLQTYPATFGWLSVACDTPMKPPGLTAYGANMAIRCDRLRNIRFDERRGMFAGQRVAGEDVSTIQRVLADGQEGWLLAGAGVHHYVHPQRLTASYLFKWQMAIGAVWAQERGRPPPGKFGVPWWAWKEFVRRALRMGCRWRPWRYTPEFLRAVSETGQYLGYLRAP